MYTFLNSFLFIIYSRNLSGSTFMLNSALLMNLFFKASLYWLTLP